MAYEFESHRPHTFHGTRYAVVAQLVERHLAKVEVASPSLVYRSIKSRQWTALFLLSADCAIWYTEMRR